jgi:hypothetical protein
LPGRAQMSSPPANCEPCPPLSTTTRTSCGLPGGTEASDLTPIEVMNWVRCLLGDCL